MRARPELVSVVIPAYNSEGTIAGQLESLTRQDYADRLEVVVADNRSSDKTAEVAWGFADRLDLQVVEAFDSQGAGPTRNVGVSVARGVLLAFLDDDDIAASNWLSEIVDIALGFDLVGGPYECLKLNSYPATAWRGIPPMDRLPMTSRMNYAFGGNFAIWRDVFDRIGGFWDRGSEDNEICWKAQIAGYTLGFAEGAIVHHRVKDSLWKVAVKQYRIATAHCSLYREFRSHGMRTKAAWWAVAEMGLALVRMPWAMLDAERRGRWVVRVAHFYGCIVGNIKERVVYF